MPKKIQKEMEVTNYSFYNPTSVIEIDKYISEHETMLIALLTRTLNEERSLLIAPTGSGKTYSIINMLKEIDVKSIFIVPNSINVEQIKIEYDISGAWGDISVLKELEKGNVIAMTWDKFIQLDEEILRDYIVILDEVHQTYIEMFRMKKINKLYENLNYAIGQIDITATPNKLNFSEYDNILEYKQKIQTKYNVKLYDKVCDDTICNIIKNSNKFALLKDDTNYLNFIKENNPSKKIDVITSNTRNLSKAYKEIVSKSTMQSTQGICNTSVLMAGVNIYESDMTDIIVVGEKDIATIKQYVARFRDLDQVNVHIFNKYKEESNTYNIEWLVDTRLHEVGIDIDYYNAKNHNETFIEQLLEISPIRLSDSMEYYWSNNFYRYIVNEVGIRNKCYEIYYNKADIYSFKILLQEYFKTVEVVEIKEADNIARKIFEKVTAEEKKQAIELLEKEKNILVGAVEVISNKISNTTQLYLDKNGFTVEDLRKELENKNIDTYIQIGNIAKTINLYSKYVIENKYNYNLAWCVANKHGEAKRKLFNQLNNIVYREIEKNHLDLMRYVKIEDKLYNFITEWFTPGISYTQEHIEDFCQMVEMTLPGVKITPKEIGKILNQIYSIDNKKYTECPGLSFLFNKIYNVSPGQNKRINVYTVKDFLTLEDIINQNNLDELSLKVLKNLLSKRIEEIEKKAIEIRSIDKLFIG